MSVSEMIMIGRKMFELRANGYDAWLAMNALCSFLKAFPVLDVASLSIHCEWKSVEIEHKFATAAAFEVL